MNKSIILACLFGAISFVSCKKDKEEENSTTTPTPTPVAVIEFEEPVADTTFALADTVHIHVHITADFDMHGYDAYLINETSTDTVWSASLHDHGMSYSIEDHWVNNVTDHSDMKLKVIAEIDHDGNTTESEIHFHCHPM